METYRKRGSIVRYENGVTLHVREEGEAVEDGLLFRCAPVLHAEPLPAMDAGAVLTTAARIAAMIPPTLAIERLIIVDGRAEHQFGERRWQDTSRRLHLSVAHGPHRILIDEDGFELEGLSEILDAFARLRNEQSSPPRLRLAPRVMAALTPALAGFLPPNLVLEQMAGGVDGYGLPVEETAGPPWPNSYRPSYRVRPRRTGMNLAVRSSVDVLEEPLPRAIALMAPVTGLELRVLCVAGGEVFPTTLRLARVDAVAPPVRAYPFAAGVLAGEAAVVVLPSPATQERVARSAG